MKTSIHKDWLSGRRDLEGFSFPFDITKIELLYSSRQEEFYSRENSHAWLQVGGKEDGDPSPFPLIKLMKKVRFSGGGYRILPNVYEKSN